MRLIIGDYCGGDPDGLFQLAHLVLSPSVEIRQSLSRFSRRVFFTSRTAARTCDVAVEFLDAMGARGSEHYPCPCRFI
jgi:purine nucleosidase